MKDPDQILDRYLDGQLTPEQLKQLDRDLRSDPNFADDFASAMLIDSFLKEKYEWQTLVSAVGLDEESANQADDANEQSWHRGLSDLGLVPTLAYVAGVGARKLVRSQSAWVTAVAAVLVLTLWLTNPFGQTQTPAPQGPVAQQPTQTQTTTYVATLTAQHNAQWAKRASARGSDFRTGSELHPGDRLTLTAGFAEITTNNGAIAILEAPATIELLDNNNAIRLHTGKLVGICETESSKGFLVRTPHMDVIDLGTRFGVDSTNADTTQVHVLQGKIKVARPSLTGNAPTTRTLIQGQAVIARAQSDGLQAIAAEPQRFAVITPRTIQLPGTGQGLAIDDVDPNWQVVAVNGTPLADVGEMIVSPATGSPGLEANAPATSQWLRVPNQLDPALVRRDGIVYTVRTQFVWPEGIDLDRASLRMRFDADDRIGQVRINGQSFTLPQHSFTDDDLRMNEATLAGGFVAGVNTIEFDVIDVVRGNAFVWAMRIAWQIELGMGPLP